MQDERNAESSCHLTKCVKLDAFQMVARESFTVIVWLLLLFYIFQASFRMDQQPPHRLRENLLAYTMLLT